MNNKKEIVKRVARMISQRPDRPGYRVCFKDISYDIDRLITCKENNGKALFYICIDILDFTGGIKEWSELGESLVILRSKNKANNDFFSKCALRGITLTFNELQAAYWWGSLHNVQRLFLLDEFSCALTQDIDIDFFRKSVSRRYPILGKINRSNVNRILRSNSNDCQVVNEDHIKEKNKLETYREWTKLSELLISLRKKSKSYGEFRKLCADSNVKFYQTTINAIEWWGGLSNMQKNLLTKTFPVLTPNAFLKKCVFAFPELDVDVSKNDKRLCRLSALNYSNKSDWLNADKCSYYKAKMNKWLDDCCKHMSIKSKALLYQEAVKADQAKNGNPFFRGGCISLKTDLWCLDQWWWALECYSNSVFLCETTQIKRHKFLNSLGVSYEITNGCSDWFIPCEIIEKIDKNNCKGCGGCEAHCIDIDDVNSYLSIIVNGETVKDARADNEQQKK